MEKSAYLYINSVIPAILNSFLITYVKIAPIYILINIIIKICNIFVIKLIYNYFKSIINKSINNKYTILINNITNNKIKCYNYFSCL